MATSLDRARDALKQGDWEAACAVALVSIAESMRVLAQPAPIPVVYHPPKVEA